MDVITITLATQIINQVCPRCKEEFAIVGYQQCVDEKEGDFLWHRAYIVCAELECGKVEAATDNNTLHCAVQQALGKYRNNV